jgi:hypothetical protein
MLRQVHLCMFIDVSKYVNASIFSVKQSKKTGLLYNLNKGITISLNVGDYQSTRCHTPGTLESSVKQLWESSVSLVFLCAFYTYP